MAEVPYGSCHCGCGGRTSIAEYTNRTKGWVKGEPKKWLKGHSQRVRSPLQLVHIGFCECGCDQRTTPAPFSWEARGMVAGMPQRFVVGHQARKLTPEYEVRDCGHETPCWVWLRSQNNKGYGQSAAPRERGKKHRMRLAHRVYYERHVGPIPAGLFLDHLCDNRACVNPAHLEPVTNGENIRRGYERRRATAVAA